MQNAYGWAGTGFIISSIASQWWPALPSLAHCILLACVGSVVICAFYTCASCFSAAGQRATYLFIGATIGILWMASVGHRYQSMQLSGVKIHQVAIIVGRVTESKFIGTRSIVVDVISVDQHPKDITVRLSLFRINQRFHIGQKIQLCAQLDYPRATQNPGGFDFTKWLVSKQVHHTGYAVPCSHNALLEPATGIASRLRQTLFELPSSGNKWAAAMVLADRSLLTDDDWRLLQQTGLAHLFTLSGLHMAWVFIFSAVFARFVVVVLRRSPVNFHHSWWVGQCICQVLSWGFIALCGWPMPLVRAGIAVSLLALARCCGFFLTPAKLIYATLLVCMIVRPFDIYGLSLYLSLSAVTTIVLFLWLYPLSANANWLAKTRYFLQLQCLLSLVMTVIVGMSFHAIHPLTLPFNVMLTPLISLLIVPVCLFGLIIWLVSERIGSLWLMVCADALNTVMAMVSTLPTYKIDSDIPIGTGILILAIVAYWLLPRVSSLPVKLLFSSVLSAGLLWPKPQHHWRIHVMDVGQGSALVIESKNHAMLIDTGAAYESYFNAARDIVLPAARTIGLPLKLDVTLTHLDNDHAAGLPYLLEQQVTNKIRRPFRGCQRGERWRVGELRVKSIWPVSDESGWSSNNSSCVLMISDGQTKLLIAGDIETKAEHALVQLNDELAADILIVPHHGSRSSSSWPFVKRVSPKWAIYTASESNRWNFPHPSVVQKYDAIGSTHLHTGQTGYIQIAIADSELASSNIDVKTWRDDLSPRWY